MLIIYSLEIQTHHAHFFWILLKHADGEHYLVTIKMINMVKGFFLCPLSSSSKQTVWTTSLCHLRLSDTYCHLTCYVVTIPAGTKKVKKKNNKISITWEGQPWPVGGVRQKMTSLHVLFIAAVLMSNIVVTFYHGNRLIFLFPIIISMVLFSWLICKAFLIVIFGL